MARPRQLRVARRMSGARHLYVHLPFCVHRCGYCDFVTAVGRLDEHGPYVDALLAELERERPAARRRRPDGVRRRWDADVHGTGALARVLGALPRADEVTVEANPETVTPELAALLRRRRRHPRVARAPSRSRRTSSTSSSVGRPPPRCGRAFATLRAAGFDNLSLDLIYGIPGQSADDLAADLDAALELEPEHLSAYELEAKPGTRFTHAWADELDRQADAMEGYAEAVVDRWSPPGLRWYETANFCRPRRSATCARSTTSRCGGARTTSASASARCRRVGRSGAGTPRRSRRYVAALHAGEAPAARARGARRRDPRVRARDARPAARRDAPARRARGRGRPRRARAARSRGGWWSARPTGIRLATAARLLGGAVTAELLA